MYLKTLIAVLGIAIVFIAVIKSHSKTKEVDTSEKPRNIPKFSGRISNNNLIGKVSKRSGPSSPAEEITRKPTSDLPDYTPEPLTAASKGVSSSVSNGANQNQELPQGKIIGASQGFVNRHFTLDEFKKNFPDIDLPDDGKGVDFISPRNNEPQIDFTALSTTCPALNSVTAALMIRIGADGYPLEVVPLSSDDYQVPIEISRCKFEGGPPTPFVTSFFPKGIFTN